MLFFACHDKAKVKGHGNNNSFNLGAQSRFPSLIWVYIAQTCLSDRLFQVIIALYIISLLVSEACINYSRHLGPRNQFLSNHTSPETEGKPINSFIQEYKNLKWCELQPVNSLMRITVCNGQSSLPESRLANKTKMFLSAINKRKQDHWTSTERQNHWNVKYMSLWPTCFIIFVSHWLIISKYDICPSNSHKDIR